MATRFNTSPYFNSHMKQPRGRGCWAFRMFKDGEVIISPSMTYAEAKKWAIVAFGPAISIDVLP